MPLLKKGIEVFPATLFEMAQARFPWGVAYVRSRQEKLLARYLQPRDVPFYVPMREQESRRGGRRFVSYLPLFPGYLFFRGAAPERLAILKSNLVVKLLDVSDPARLHAELSQLRYLQETGASLTPYPSLVPGDPVRIVEGPFKGYTGTVVRRAALPRLVITISMLNKSVAVELGRGDVAPLRAEAIVRGRGRHVA